jgi:hypothetical protein
MRPPLRHAIAVLAALALSACAIFGGPADRALRRTPSFKAGYADGCSAANAVDTDVRHPQEPDPYYSTDRVYQTGWSNGFQTCRRTMSQPGSGLGQPMPGPNLGH